MKLITFLNTIKYLKLIQLYRKLVIKFNKIRLKLYHKKLQSNYSEFHQLDIENISSNEFDNNLFIFDNILNKSNINWNDETEYKLWNYHLHYFDYLLNLKKNTGLKIVPRIIKKYLAIKI